MSEPSFVMHFDASQVAAIEGALMSVIRYIDGTPTWQRKNGQAGREYRHSLARALQTINQLIEVEH